MRKLYYHHNFGIEVDMAKSHPFSIYLLKSQFDAASSIEEDDNDLVEITTATQLPPHSRLFVSDNINGQPWWKSYFGVPRGEKELPLTSKGGLLFTSHSERCFAMTFGRTHHKIKDEAIEYDFGLRVTLNCVDPERLNSTDTHDPGTARRQRTQIPNAADLTFFDFDYDSNVLKSLTGKVKPKFEHLFRNATGSHSFKFSTKKTADELYEILTALWQLYLSEDYLETFPNIRNISPVNDPQIVQNLNEQLLDGLIRQDENLYLTIPDSIDYGGQLKTKFSGFRGNKTYEEVYLQNYYNYLNERNKNIDSLTIDDLKSNKVLQLDENDNVKSKHSLFKCLVYDTKLSGETAQTYHLSEGHWFKVEDEYVNQMRSYLDPLCNPTNLPDFAHSNEGEYNSAVAENMSANFICLDRKNIAPAGVPAIEPCDLYFTSAHKVSFVHVKRSTFSQQLSHLFNQGLNSAEVIRKSPVSREKLKELVEEACTTSDKDFVVPAGSDRFDVRYAIITHKDPKNKSENLPFFSRISLMRTLKQLQSMGLDYGYEFIPDKQHRLQHLE